MTRGYVLSPTGGRIPAAMSTDGTVYLLRAGRAFIATDAFALTFTPNGKA